MSALPSMPSPHCMPHEIRVPRTGSKTRSRRTQGKHVAAGLLTYLRYSEVVCVILPTQDCLRDESACVRLSMQRDYLHVSKFRLAWAASGCLHEPIFAPPSVSAWRPCLRSGIDSESAPHWHASVQAPACVNLNLRGDPSVACLQAFLGSPRRPARRTCKLAQAVTATGTMILESQDQLKDSSNIFKVSGTVEGYHFQCGPVVQTSTSNGVRHFS